MSFERLEVVYIAPSRYDDDGYVIRWHRGVVPSNSLACLRGATSDLAQSDPFDGVKIRVRAYDESVQRLPIRKIAARAHSKGTKVVVGLVGVQSNQFVRATDIALDLRSHGVAVMIGGFHVSGMLALFDETAPELAKLTAAGVSLVQGEIETPGSLEKILGDMLEERPASIYRLPKSPDLTHAPLPDVDRKYARRFVTGGTLDTSRGCPFDCSFCTIINVQGRKMRSRSAENVLTAIRRGLTKGVSRYFFTDDNFSRSPIWRELFEGLLAMREEEGLTVQFMMQVDAPAYKIPGFIDAAKAAGCYMVFVGMESVNPENLESAGKSQNHPDDYRRMVEAWHESGILVHVGYIIGFPADTEESVAGDIVLLRDFVGVDKASFFMMTPLPGSRDHFDMVRRGDPLDPDLNNYDSCHETFQHPRMGPGRWRAATDHAYDDFYTKENIVEILRRVPREQYWRMFKFCLWYRYAGVYNRTHPMATGLIRRKNRKTRRPGFPRESIFHFRARRIKDAWRELLIYMRLFREFQEIWLLTRRREDPRLAPLTELRARWSGLQQHLAAYRWSGRLDDAASEVRTVFHATADRLVELSRTPRKVSRSQAAKLRRAAADIEGYLRSFELSIPDGSNIAKALTFLNQRMIAPYDEYVHHGVKMRRRLNRWTRDCVDKLKHGRLFSPTLWRAPLIFFGETALAIRFGIGALHERFRRRRASAI